MSLMEARTPDALLETLALMEEHDSLLDIPVICDDGRKRLPLHYVRWIAERGLAENTERRGSREEFVAYLTVIELSIEWDEKRVGWTLPDEGNGVDLVEPDDDDGFDDHECLGALCEVCAS